MGWVFVRVFVCYRRDDSSAYAGRLGDALAERLGRRKVFHDVAAIAAGSNFEEAIQRAVHAADAMLVVIGPHWLEPGPDGRARLHDPTDQVRLEVARALAAGLPVVPALVGGAALPEERQLPVEIGELARRQAFTLRDDSWQADVDALLASLRGRRAGPSRRWWPWVVGVAALAAVAVALALAARDGDDDGVRASAPSCEAPTEPEWTRIAGPDAAARGGISTADGTIEFEVERAFFRASDGDWAVALDSVVTNLTASPRYIDEFTFSSLEIERFPSEPATCFAASPTLLEPGQATRVRVGFRVAEDPTSEVVLVVDVEEIEQRIDLTTGR